ncbi:MAG: hypothetical protein IIB15_06070 [Chloroflexi bacterium]|nr:hypothetical protein [Chloroflexota bacterium]
MNELIAGAASGFLMASVFVGAGMIMLFIIVRNPPPGLQPIFEKIPPATIAMSVVVLAYPTWGAIGAVTGLLYKVSVEQIPGGGIGSPNMVFTLGIVVVAVMMAAPFVILLRQVLSGVLTITIAFIVIFGWFLPYFAR